MLLFYNLTQLYQSAVILQGVNHDNSCRSCACLQKKKALLSQGFCGMNTLTLLYHITPEGAREWGKHHNYLTNLKT